jgi:hypothetical protein
MKSVPTSLVRRITKSSLQDGCDLNCGTAADSGIEVISSSCPPWTALLSMAGDHWGWMLQAATK